MPKEYTFDTEKEFLQKLEELTQQGIPSEKINYYSPYLVHRAEEILQSPPSKLKFFTLTGAITGICTGAALTIYTSAAWPLLTSGKPIISIPPFLVIMFELFILLGCIFSLIGFLFLAKLPDPYEFVPEKEYGNQFVIVVDEEKD